MRIISGTYKGRKIDGYEIVGTRPTQDRMKESLFAMIQDEIRGATVLDLFAGSGNLGIEALSNGAIFTSFVDSNKKCCEVIQKNLASIPEETYQIQNLDYQKALFLFEQEKKSFDIILLDPPYQLSCFHEILIFFGKNDLLKEDGIVICEYEIDQFQEEYPNLILEKEKKYGYKKIRIYRKRSNP